MHQGVKEFFVVFLPLIIRYIGKYLIDYFFQVIFSFVAQGFEQFAQCCFCWSGFSAVSNRIGQHFHVGLLYLQVGIAQNVIIQNRVFVNDGQIAGLKQYGYQVEVIDVKSPEAEGTCLYAIKVVEKLFPGYTDQEGGFAGGVPEVQVVVAALREEVQDGKGIVERLTIYSPLITVVPKFKLFSVNLF